MDRIQRENNLSPGEIDVLRIDEEIRLTEGKGGNQPEPAAVMVRDPGATRSRLEISRPQFDRIHKEMEDDLNLRKYLNTLEERPEFAQDEKLPEIDAEEWEELIKKANANFSGYVRIPWWQSDPTGKQKRVYKYFRSGLIGENTIVLIEGHCRQGAGPAGLVSFQAKYRPESVGGEPMDLVDLGAFFFGEKYGDLTGTEKTLMGAFLFTVWKRELEALYRVHRGKYTAEFSNDAMRIASEVISQGADRFAQALRKSRAEKMSG